MSMSTNLEFSFIELFLNLPSKSRHLSLPGVSSYLPTPVETTDIVLSEGVTFVLSASPFSKVGVGPRLSESCLLTV